MRLHQIWTAAFIALGLHSGAAFAEVTVSQSNDPKLLLGVQFASLMDAEHATLDAMPEGQRTALASGPQKAPAKQDKRKAKAGAPVALSYTHAFLASLLFGAHNCLGLALYYVRRHDAFVWS